MVEIKDKPAIAPSAQIATTAITGDDVSIGDNTIISDYVVIRDGVSIGANCKIYPHAVIGEDPQDYSYKGERTFVEIGDNNILREFTTVHKAVGEGNKTIIGDNNMLMVHSHVGHNVVLGNNITMANSVQIGGHCIIDDNVVLGGNIAIHQNCRVGRFVMFSGLSASNTDLPPFMTCSGRPAIGIGINRFGLKKAGFSRETCNELFKAYKIIYLSGLNTQNIIAKLQNDLEQIPEIIELTEFIANSKKGIKRSRSKIEL